MTKFEEWKIQFESTKVIVRSNENEQFEVGELIGYETIGSNEFPLVLINGKPFVSLGIVIPWSREMEFFLNSLEPKKQWEILSSIVIAIGINRE